MITTIASISLALCLFFSPLHAQDTGKKSYIFRGTVEQVSADFKRLTVSNEAIDGWMDAMTMAYAVDKPEVLARLKVGDRITAKVYDDDTKLYEVAVVAQPQSTSPPQKEEAKRSYLFRGTVEQVNPNSKRLTVSNEPIDGWMGAMTMAYAIDKPEVLAQLKAGDRITAKVYDGDTKLYDVAVVPQPQNTTRPKNDATGLRLEDFEKMALASNPTMAQTEANVRIANGLKKQAGLYPNPAVGYYGDEIRGGYSGGGKQGGFISQTIVTGGKLRAARRVADLQVGQVQTTVEMQRLRITNNVRSMFYHVLSAQRLVEVRRNLAKLAADATEVSYQLANVGQADRPDLLQSEIERQQAKINLRVAQQSLQASWRALAAVAGKPDLPIAALEGDLDTLPELGYPEWLAATLKDSPVVKLAQQSVERAEASLVQARKAPIPDLQLYGNLSQNYEPLETTRKPIGLNGGVQIGVQIPIFNRNQGNIAAARGEIESAKQELLRVKLQLTHELANLFRDYDSARLTADEYKKEMLPRAEQAYKLYQANYQNMAAAYPQALISQRTLFQLQAEYVQALENAWQNVLVIRGYGLMDGLSAPMNPSSGMGQSANAPSASRSAQ